MKISKFVKSLSAIIAAIILVLLAYFLLIAAHPKSMPPPNPNGYDIFVRAGKMLIGDPHRYFTMTGEQLRAFVSTNEDAIKLGRTGLASECRMPVDYSPQFMGKYIDQAMAIKALALTFCAQGKLAKLDKQTNDSIQNYLEAISLGEKSCVGGFMQAKLVGISCEYEARSGLQSWKDGLDASQCRVICTTLESIDENEESVDAVLAQEKKWIREGSTMKEKIENITDFWKIPGYLKDLRDNFQENQLLRRRMMITFAARAYELESGKPPANMTDLVPTYLKAIPKDLATGTNLMLSP